MQRTTNRENYQKVWKYWFEVVLFEVYFGANQEKDRFLTLFWL